MKQKIFTIFDTMSESYRVPFFLPTVGQAVRAITDCVDNPEHEFGRHPDHYILMEIGEYDDSNAKMVPIAPQSVGNLVEFKTPGKPDRQVDILEELERAVKTLSELAK